MNMTAIIITAIICFTVMVIVTTICKAVVEKDEIYYERLAERFNLKKEDDNARS